MGEPEPETVDAETVDQDAPAAAVPDEPPAPAPGTELEIPAAGASNALIIGATPDDVIAKASEIGTALTRLIEDRGLAANMGGGRKHVEVGAWQALGALIGTLGGTALHAETVWTRLVCLPDGTPVRRTYTATVKRYHKKADGGGLREEVTYEVDGHDWEAKVEVRTLDGRCVGSAEGMVSRTEETWNDRDEYAVRSMAETRAESRAYRRAVGWLVNIAGYNPTPAEEMPDVVNWGPAAVDETNRALSTGLMHVLADEQKARAAYAMVKEPFGYLPETVALIVVALLRQLVSKSAPAPAGDEPAAAPAATATPAEPDPVLGDGPQEM